MTERAQALEAIRERLKNFETVKHAMDRIGNTPLATTRYVEDVTTLLDLLDVQPTVASAGASEPPKKWIPTEGCTCYLCRAARLSPAPVSPVEPTPNDTLLRNIRMAAAMGLSFGHQATPQPMERMVERKDKRLRQILTLLAEHGVTGSMLRAESNAPVEPTPEPPTDDTAYQHPWHCCPMCGGVHTNSGEKGGNQRCYHCALCSFVACVPSSVER